MPDSLIQNLRFPPKIILNWHPLLSTADGHLVLERLLNIENEPLNITHVNQLLHLSHDTGMIDGFGASDRAAIA